MKITFVKLSLAALTLCSFLSGCSPRMDHLFDKLMGHNSQTVLLAESSISIGPEGVSLVAKESVKVLGSSADVCLVLKSNIGSPSQPESEVLIKEALGGAELSSTIATSSGQTFDLSCVGQAWRKYGLVTPDEELSVCLSRGCESKLPINAEISAITIRASSPVRILGVYWESTDALDEK